MNPPFALILSGPPGAGKTTLAAQVAMTYSPSIAFEADSLWTSVVRGGIDPWKSEAHEQNRVLVRTSLRAAASLCEGGFSTVLSAHVGPGFLAEMGTEMSSFVVPVHYIVLRPTLAECLARCVERREDPRHAGALRDEDAIRHLYAGYADLGEYERFVLDTGSMNIEDSVEAVRAALGSERFRLRGDLS